MIVLMFKTQFAELVRSGQKLQTVRPERKRPVKVGDTLSLRQWSGLSYRSRQLYLREATCIYTFPVEIDHLGMFSQAGFLCARRQRDDFARADGFADYPDMLAWFKATHGLPFKGVCIQWT